MMNRRRRIKTLRRSGSRLRVICVLLIETDHAAFVFFNRILTEYGCSVTWVRSSGEIHEALAMAKFDLILLGTSARDEAAGMEELINRQSAAPLAILSSRPSPQSACTAPAARSSQADIVAALMLRIEAWRSAT